MPNVTQPLRDEHAEILPHVEEVRAAADAVGELAREDLAERIDHVHGFLAGHLIAHAEAEEVALYPVVGEVCGAAEVTATMSAEHTMIGAMVDELGQARAELDAGRLDAELERELRRLLYGLHAVVSAHFTKEEEVLLPLLDARLSPARARQMFEALQAAAQQALGETVHHHHG